MAHDVFISYSSKDKAIADAVCGTLEGKRICCWIAPRDVLPGLPYGEAILDAIQSSRVMVLVFSSSADKSPQVLREVERAVSKGIPIIPLRIEEVLPSKSLEYFLSAPHWLDAFTPPLEKHLQSLVKIVALLASRHSVRREDETGADPGSETEMAGKNSRPLVSPESVRFAFVGMGEQAPHWVGPQDRLWLDVGNDLRPGVIDHHHGMGGSGSTTSLLLASPVLLDRSVMTCRRSDAAFTLVLHEKPDLDAVAAAYLALSYLCTAAFPAGAEALARYMDEIDEGVRGMTQDNPFSLYAAFQQLANRLVRRPGSAPHEIWQELVRSGIRLVQYAVEQAKLGGISVAEVDGFACPGLFDAVDREEIANDLERYRRKLADPHSRVRWMRLRLPGQLGGTVEVEALLARDVENADDPERCMFFKDWARTDSSRSADGKGFAALCIFCSEGLRQARRAILSVTPASKASLRGLGALLDRAEADRRRQLFGVDDRVVEPATGTPKAPRPGYDNADPWYNGRAHRYSIVDSPRAGTLLTAEEVERAFLAFAGVHSG